MFSAIFVLASMTAWTYGGFLAQPSLPAVPPVVAPSEPAMGPAAIPPPPLAVVPPSPKPAERPPNVEATAAPSLPVNSTPFGEARYQLADVSGQLWEHADPVVLQEFVRDRNRQIAVAPR